MNARIQVLEELDSICEINSSLGERLDQISKERKASKIQSILAKGEDMNTSELKYLLDVGVHHSTICNALNMYFNDYRQMIKSFVAMTEKNDNSKGRKSTISIDRYVSLYRQGLETIVIAKRLGCTSKQLSGWKRYHKDKINQFMTENAVIS